VSRGSRGWRASSAVVFPLAAIAAARSRVEVLNLMNPHGHRVHLREL
jgi:hypothetical protein